jgi:hypothetical protein
MYIFMYVYEHWVFIPGIPLCEFTTWGGECARKWTATSLSDYQYNDTTWRVDFRSPVVAIEKPVYAHYANDEVQFRFRIAVSAIIEHCRVYTSKLVNRVHLVITLNSAFVFVPRGQWGSLTKQTATVRLLSLKGTLRMYFCELRTFASRMSFLLLWCYGDNVPIGWHLLLQLPRSELRQNCRMQVFVVFSVVNGVHKVTLTRIVKLVANANSCDRPLRSDVHDPHLVLNGFPFRLSYVRSCINSISMVAAVHGLTSDAPYLLILITLDPPVPRE